jgi:hypothetical protein
LTLEGTAGTFLAVPFDFNVVGKTFGPNKLAYDWQRVALYALSCGATADELDLLLETRGLSGGGEPTMKHHPCRA